MRMATEELSHAKKNKLFWQNLKSVRVLQLPSLQSPFRCIIPGSDCISTCCSSAVIWSDRDSSSDGSSVLAHGIKSDYSSHHLRMRLDQIIVAVCLLTLVTFCKTKVAIRIYRVDTFLFTVATLGQDLLRYMK